MRSIVTSPSDTLIDSSNGDGGGGMSLGAIIGAVAGALAALILMVVLLLVWGRRRSRTVEGRNSRRAMSHGPMPAVGVGLGAD